jgi:putative membrane protein
MNFFLHWIVAALAVIIGAYLVPGVDTTIVGAAVLVVVLSLMNAFLKPLISFLTLPLNVITLGLFTFVTNALLIMLASLVVPGFSVSGFVPALVFSIVLALVNAFFAFPNRKLAS